MQINRTILVLFVSGWASCVAQNSNNTVLDLKAKHPSGEYENVFVEKLNSDSLQSSFLIWIKKEVKMHKHISHSESVYVIEGKAKMYLGDTSFTISEGSNLLIPINTPHKVVTEGIIPLKVLSVQAPSFDGSDRIVLEK